MSSENFAFTKNIYGIKIIDNDYKPKFILGLLNSKLLNFYYRKKFTMKKEDIFPEIQTYLYEQLPIPKINPKNSKIAEKIVNLVEQILALKNPCHTERSEVSQENRDISAFAKPQYDKDTNPQAVLFNLPNTKNTKKSKQSKALENSNQKSPFLAEWALQGEVSARNDDTSKLEQEIDKLVYSLYDLNENEIELIEK